MNIRRSNISVLAMRKEPSHRSEMVSQILFGDEVRFHEQNQDWALISTLHDSYCAWIESKHFEQFDTNLDREVIVCNTLIQGKASNRSLHIPFGSYSTILSFFDREDYMNFDTKIEISQLFLLFERIMMDVPYLWGGRTVFGVDCSGLSQLFYRFLGIDLLRDASLQISQGVEIDFEERRIGDLIFFQNDQNKISHVGILRNKQTILHSSGEVRIDQLDAKGIFRLDMNIHTHRMHSIRRIL